jgi:hypothetical protein
MDWIDTKYQEEILKSGAKDKLNTLKKIVDNLNMLKNLRFKIEKKDAINLASRPRSRSNSKPKVMPVPEQIEKYM